MLTGQRDDSAPFIFYVPKTTATSLLPLIANKEYVENLHVPFEALQK